MPGVSRNQRAEAKYNVTLDCSSPPFFLRSSVPDPSACPRYSPPPWPPLRRLLRQPRPGHLRPRSRPARQLGRRRRPAPSRRELRRERPDSASAHRARRRRQCPEVRGAPFSWVLSLDGLGFGWNLLGNVSENTVHYLIRNGFGPSPPFSIPFLSFFYAL